MGICGEIEFFSENEMGVEVVSLLGEVNKWILGDCRFIGLSDWVEYAPL